MSYVALYRKFRPSIFEDVKGQDAIIATLRNQIISDHLGHAYLFCGTRGTGKTSVAKLLAKAVNCESPENGNPCGKCKMCKAIATGSSMNVIEIDAASNNGIENIREIIEEVSYSPTEGKYKVYIIDEVHMLSVGAFNALLKTLEEPPSYVIFILATTEVHKIPITILSRCARYDFKRISSKTIADRMHDFMIEENQIVEEKALQHIGRIADGSMRDALSLLDQCIAFTCGGELTYDMTLEILGAVDMRVFRDMLNAVEKQKINEAIHILEEITMQGRELTQFVSDFTWYLRNVLLVQTNAGVESLVDVSAENLKMIEEDSKTTTMERLIRYIRIFSELGNQIKFATQKRILTEIAIIKLCKPSMETDLTSLLERVRQVEDKLENGNFTVAQMTESRNSENTISKQVEKKKEYPKALPEDIKSLVAKWDMLVEKSKGMMHAILAKAKPSYVEGDNAITLVFEKDVLVDYGDATDTDINNYFAEELGKEVSVKYVKDTCDEDGQSEFLDIRKMIQMEIVEEND
jgi:DNA polymerase-3 subunit gamma/tau